jgi:rubrerythrin
MRVSIYVNMLEVLMERPTPLPPPMRRAGDLLALAHALEEEAASRYLNLASKMRLCDENELAELFSFLSHIEEKHAHQVETRSHELLGTPPDPARVQWEVPENFDEEAARSATLTPYGALAIAVRNEERAFAFYCHAAAAAPPKVAAIAEDLARDELEHAALLRRARREAWRREQRPAPAPALPDTVAALRSGLQAERAAAARLHATLATRLDAEGDTVLAAAFRQVAQEEDPAGTAGDVAATVRDGLRVLEEAFERLSEIAARTTDTEVMAAAQQEAERTVRWLALAGGAWRNSLLEPHGDQADCTKNEC